MTAPPGAAEPAEPAEPAEGAEIAGGAALVEELRRRLVENRASVHGPVPWDRAASLVVELAGSAGSIAVAVGDPVVQRGGVAPACGDRLVAPDAPDWPERLAAAPVGVTGARLAVADTGSLVLVPGPGAPRATSLLPDRHVCLVPVEAIVATVADAVRELAAAGPPPVVVWVGGPSRTSDLEMRPTWGVHGPVALDAVLVGRA